MGYSSSKRLADHLKEVNFNRTISHVTAIHLRSLEGLLLKWSVNATVTRKEASVYPGNPDPWPSTSESLFGRTQAVDNIPSSFGNTL